MTELPCPLRYPQWSLTGPHDTLSIGSFATILAVPVILRSVSLTLLILDWLDILLPSLHFPKNLYDND
jgi:hypothetical protein